MKMAEGRSKICNENEAEICHSVTILSIPEEILETILSYLSFNDISELRPVRLIGEHQCCKCLVVPAVS